MDSVSADRENSADFQKPQQKAIIVNGFSENEKVVEAQKLGAGPYLKKPYKLINIASILRTVLSKK